MGAKTQYRHSTGHAFVLIQGSPNSSTYSRARHYDTTSAGFGGVWDSKDVRVSGSVSMLPYGIYLPLPPA